MENITSVKIMPAKKVFESTHMMLTLPITEKAMTAEMAEYTRDIIDRWSDTENYGGYSDFEATLSIDVYSDGTKYFSLTVDVYFNDEDEPPETSIEYFDLSPEIANYYYNMAVKQLAENFARYSK